MKFTKILALALVFIMALTMVVSCVSTEESEETTGNPSQTNDPNEITTEGVTTEKGYETDKQGYELSGLPDKTFDDIFHLFSWSDQLHWEFNAKEETGEPIYDEVYRRKQYLLDKYGITVQVSSTSGNWDTKDDYIKKVEANQSETGDNAYDAIGCYFCISGAMTVKGFFEDLSNKEYAPYIDLDRRWWPDDLLGSAKVNNAVYAITGDITPTFIRNLSVCHTNLDLFEQYNDGVNPYKLVRDMEWTYDKLQELALNKVPTTGDKRFYAITMDSNVLLDDVFYSAGFTFVDNLDDGTVKMHDLSSDQKMIDFFDYIRSLTKDHADVVVGMTMQAAGGFKEGQGMFHIGSAAQIQNYLLEVDWDYASLPMPMYKNATYTTQDQYYSVQGFWTTLYSIPINCDDYELASFAIEALAWYGYRYLTPTWFNESFQNRFLETPDNAQMFEIIKTGVRFDTGRVFGTHIDCFGTFRKLYTTDQSLPQLYAERIESWSTAIDQINTSLGKNQ